MRVIPILLTLFVTACVSTYPVVKIDAGTYQVSADASLARGGIAGAQSLAVAGANRHCGLFGKTTNVTHVETGDYFPVAGWAIITFTCT